MIDTQQPTPSVMTAPCPKGDLPILQGLDALELVRAPVWVFDMDFRRVLWGNAAAVRLWRANNLDELRARDLGKDMSTTVAARIMQYQADFITHGAVFHEQWTFYPAGQPVSMNLDFSGYRLPDGRMAMLCEGRVVESRSPEQLRSLEALLHTPLMISLYRFDGVPLYRNPAARASVRSFAEPMDQRFTQTEASTQLLQRLDEAGHAKLTMVVETAAGQRWHEVSAIRGVDAVTGEATILLSEVDVTALKDSEAKAFFLSEHDVLTGLPNRACLQRHFARLTAQPLAHLQRAALVLIDLDRFKDINDAWGHAAGDELLSEVASRLKAAVRHVDLVARFGGDEFVILLHSAVSRQEIDQIYGRIRQAMAQAFVLSGTQAHVSATFGVSLFPEHGQDFETLLQHADLAMYSGKAGGRNALAYYESGMSSALRARRSLEDELRRALCLHEFETHYQARVAQDGRVVGAEALVRWRHPERGLVMPGEFITVMEDAGLIRELGRQVFAMAVKQQAQWAAAGHQLKLSANLSPSEFEDPSLLEDLALALREAGCAPESVELEVTESMLIGRDDRPMMLLQGIQALGLSIALDDFGTGYSNLAYLQRFPFSTLKIDKAFVQAQVSDRPLAEAIVALCRALGVRPVAEGVETLAQCNWLRHMGVDEFQGFLFARPMPPAQFDALLNAQEPLQAIARQVQAMGSDTAGLTQPSP